MNHIKYILDNIKNVEVPQSDVVESENIIDGLVESKEYTPIYKENLTHEIENGDYLYTLTFDYDERMNGLSSLGGVELDGKRLEI